MENAFLQNKHMFKMTNNGNRKINLDFSKEDRQSRGMLQNIDVYSDKNDVIKSEFMFQDLQNINDDHNFSVNHTTSIDETMLDHQNTLSSLKKENNFYNQVPSESHVTEIKQVDTGLKQTDNVEKVVQNNECCENSENDVKSEALNDNECSQDTNVDKESRKNSEDVVMMDGQLCKVCGDSSVSSLFGSVVCVPCKTFFLRYGLDCKNFKCKASGNCVITPQNRTKCKYCRYKRCSEIGMWKKARTSEVMMKEGQQACVVCSDLANGVHFGAVTCEGCKKFFRRGLTEHSSYTCKQFKSCEVNPQTRNACRYCRYQKCLKVGMSREAIKMGRPSKSKSESKKTVNNSNYIKSVIEDVAKSINNDTMNNFTGSSLNESFKSDEFDSEEPKNLPNVDKETDYKSGIDDKLIKNNSNIYDDKDNLIGMLNNESIPDIDRVVKSDEFNSEKNVFNRVGSTTDSNTNSASYYKNAENAVHKTEHFTNIENNVYPPSVQSYNNSSNRMLCAQNAYGHENNFKDGFNHENNFNKKIPYTYSHFQNDQLNNPNTVHYNLAFSRNYIKPYPYRMKYPYGNYNKTDYYGNKRPNVIKSNNGRNFHDIPANPRANFDKINFINHNENYNHNAGIFNKKEKFLYNNNVFQQNEVNYSVVSAERLAESRRLSHLYERSFSASPKNHDFDNYKNRGNFISNNNNDDDNHNNNNNNKDTNDNKNNSNNNDMINDLSQNRNYLENNQENIENQEILDESSQKKISENSSMTKSQFEYIEEQKELLDKKLNEQLRQQQSTSPKKIPRRMSHMSLDSMKSFKAEDSQLSSSDDFKINLSSSSHKSYLLGHIKSLEIFEKLQKKALLDDNQELNTTSSASKLSHVSSSSNLAQFQKLSQLLPSSGDRSSPYNPIMSLLTSCSLFNEASKNPYTSSNSQSQTEPKVKFVLENIKEDSSTDNDDGANSCSNQENSSKFLLPSNKFKKNSSILKFLGLKEELRNKLIEEYWLTYDQLPDESLMLTTKHFSCICNIIKAYKKFLECGSNINSTLKKELELWNQQSQVPLQGSISLPEWIQVKVIPVYTFSSLIYCKCLPGFTELSQGDQATLIRLGQTQSRILLAAIHWFNAQKGAFDDFLSWRPMDLFKKSLLSYAKKIQLLQLDFIEAALLNALLVLAADYPGLENPSQVNDLRQNILIPFRAYTTAKFGTPNKRLEDIFTHVPETRKLGYLHYQMTMKTSLKAEEVEKCNEWQE